MDEAVAGKAGFDGLRQQQRPPGIDAEASLQRRTAHLLKTFLRPEALGVQQAGGAEHDPQHRELGHRLGEVQQRAVITEINSQVAAPAAGAEHRQTGGPLPQLLRQGPTDAAVAHHQGLTTPAAQVASIV